MGVCDVIKRNDWLIAGATACFITAIIAAFNGNYGWTAAGVALMTFNLWVVYDRRKQAAAITATAFIDAMIGVYSERDNAISARLAALATLADIEKVTPFGDSECDWSEDAARDIARAEMATWS